jgi:c-di-GMP-binding flagellar brake protein YcgR
VPAQKRRRLVCAWNACAAWTASLHTLPVTGRGSRSRAEYIAFAEKHMNLNPDASEDLSPYQIRSRREIISLLRNVAANNQLIQMQANNGAESIVTSILEVDDATDTVVIDCAPSAIVNERILESDDLSFDTALDRIRILFRASAVESCVREGRPALRIGLPDNVIRLQRREFYRVQTPVVSPVQCTIKIPNGDNETTGVVTTLYNVSGGGIAIVDEKKQLDADFDRIYSDCRIDLPGGPVAVALQIRSAQNVTLTNGKQIRRLGCEFVNPSPGTLAAIQRYITKLEREQNARATGLG